MKTFQPDLLAFTRACERLLSRQVTLTEEERDLLDYYLKEMSHEFQSNAPTVRVCPSDPPGLKTQAGA